MNGPAVATSGIVDIVRVNTNQTRALIPQILGGFLRQEWMIAEVSRRVPMFTPTRMNENRFAEDVDTVKFMLFNLELNRMRRAHDNGGQIRELVQVYLT